MKTVHQLKTSQNANSNSFAKLLTLIIPTSTVIFSKNFLPVLKSLHHQPNYDNIWIGFFILLLIALLTKVITVQC
jgi:hypothetical protein